MHQEVSPHQGSKGKCESTQREFCSKKTETPEDSYSIWLTQTAEASYKLKLNLKCIFAQNTVDFVPHRLQYGCIRKGSRHGQHGQEE